MAKSACRTVHQTVRFNHLCLPWMLFLDTDDSSVAATAHETSCQMRNHHEAMSPDSTTQQVRVQSELILLPIFLVFHTHV